RVAECRNSHFWRLHAARSAAVHLCEQQGQPETRSEEICRVLPEECSRARCRSKVHPFAGRCLRQDCRTPGKNGIGLGLWRDSRGGPVHWRNGKTQAGEMMVDEAGSVGGTQAKLTRGSF